MVLVEKCSTLCDIAVISVGIVPCDIVVVILAVIKLDNVPAVCLASALARNIVTFNAYIVQAQLIEPCISFANAKFLIDRSHYAVRILREFRIAVSVIRICAVVYDIVVYNKCLVVVCIFPAYLSCDSFQVRFDSALCACS